MRPLQSSDVAELAVLASLRARAFYEDLAERQQLPCPPRFAASFEKDFASREAASLSARISGRSGASLRCVCLAAFSPDDDTVLGGLDVSCLSGAPASTVSGSVVPPQNGAPFLYIDNAVVAEPYRRSGVASALLRAASVVAEAGAQPGQSSPRVWAHVDADNLAARRLYAGFGFEAFVDEGGAAPAGARPRGLLLLSAPLPLAPPLHGESGDGGCGCGAARWPIACACRR